jgi:predicted homoserine dehydrogenase-like protein
VNYELLFSELKDRTIRMAVTGAKGGFGRTLLAQCRTIPSLEATALCDLDVEGTMRMLRSLGFAETEMAACETGPQVREAAAAGRTAVFRDYHLLAEAPLDIVVEATGSPEVSTQIAVDAMRRGVHVAMVSKETEATIGPALSRVAEKHGVVYTTADGDQPSNLIGLITWARVLGFEVVAAGKSSEYDYIFDPESGVVEWTDRRMEAPALRSLWQLGANVPATMRARSQAICELPQRATPDYCEMNVVANSTGLAPACDELHFPLCRIAELAEVFIPEADGGILQRTGVVDVFNCLRRPDEPSFAGGIFAVVRCRDGETWEVLRQKGHLVSRNGKYACIYVPFHIMGQETPITLFSAVLHKRASGAALQGLHAVMAVRTERAFRAGEVLKMGGHQHNIEGTRAFLLPATRSNCANTPFYVVANQRLQTDVPAGTFITPEMVELGDSTVYGYWRQMQSMLVD